MQLGVKLSDKLTMLLLVGLALSLIGINGAIWQKEQLIANGKPVYLKLAPADPRSLMQGDFMRLRFAGFYARALKIETIIGQRPVIRLSLDAQSVATPKVVYKAGEALAEGEILLELTPNKGSWMPVTDAWFFREGQAQQWETARYGEFRILPSGKALLVPCEIKT